MSKVSEEEANGTVGIVDEAYEFSAPKFYDFTIEESDGDVRKAELWFETALSHGPSPFMPRIKARRSFKIESECDLSEANQTIKVAGTESTSVADASVQEDGNKENLPDLNSNKMATKQEEAAESEKIARNVSSVVNEPSSGQEMNKSEVCSTPKPPTDSQKDGLLTTSQRHKKSAKQVPSAYRNQASKTNGQSQSSHIKGTQHLNMGRGSSVKNTIAPTNFAQDNQAIKRQKLDGGNSRQILNLKPPQPLPHKSKLGLAGASLNSGSAGGNRLIKEERKVYVREQAAPVAPFVSTAELMKRFESSTRDKKLPQFNTTYIKTKLTLTRPKQPEFETSQRVRSVKVKSTAELEEEMMAKIPKFKARPLNKKILEGPSLVAPQRSTPKPPEFHEFHFETSTRANQNCDAASVASTEVSHQNIQWKPNHLTEPKTPVLHTSLRARPPRVKSFFELEKEEIEKVPKFKARPLNKKIFETKGEMGIFCNTKKQVTVPQEFHFATNERIPPPTTVGDLLFDKLSLNSETRHNDHPIPKKTMPNPFHLHTEERGAEKERNFATELMQKQLEEERARVRKANPYPYTTDYPVFPPKPEPKPCTKPEPFQLESLVRHDEEIQREKEERQRKEKEEAQMRIFKAQPVLKEDPIPLPEKLRKPLTQVEQFNLHVDQRAPERAEFDQKVKEKEMVYKRYREESEAAKMIEEEKALKQLRRTMVPQARPIPNFEHPFYPRKSTKEITHAKSPNLEVLRRKERRMMKTMLNTASSSPAFNMR